MRPLRTVKVWICRGGSKEIHSENRGFFQKQRGYFRIKGVFPKTTMMMVSFLKIESRHTYTIHTDTQRKHYINEKHRIERILEE